MITESVFISGVPQVLGDLLSRDYNKEASRGFK